MIVRHCIARLSLLIGSVVGPTPADANGDPTASGRYARASTARSAVYGQAFKDNGYRMKVGTDDLRLKEPGYWPVFAWLWKNYPLEVERADGETVQRRGGIAAGVDHGLSGLIQSAALR